MIHPFDLQVAWKAIPEQGNLVLQKEVSLLSRVSENLKGAHIRNVEQSDVTVKISNTASKPFYALGKSEARYKNIQHNEEGRSKALVSRFLRYGRETDSTSKGEVWDSKA